MSSNNNERLSNEERLCKSQVSKLFENSSLAKGKYFVIRAVKNGLHFNRIAPIASKKAGNAAKRNRIKRRIKALYRQHKKDLPYGYDLAIIARYGVIDADFLDLTRSLIDVTQKACTICDKDTSNSSDTINKVPLPEDNRTDDT